MNPQYFVIAAGHLCLDIFPNLEHLPKASFNALFQPGHLVEVGSAHFSSGGPVSNTGLALHRLGIPTRLAAKIGADPFGSILTGIIAQHGPELVSGINVDAHSVTSYSIIISPPETDRIFLHCPGANDQFDVHDLPMELVEKATLFHFGYPPIMRKMYTDGGRHLVELLKKVKETGTTTSLDMAYPDPGSESGQSNWRAILKDTLPYVDIFLPSFEELLFLLHPELHAQITSLGNGQVKIEARILDQISQEILDMGVKILVIKLGESGLYLRSHNAKQINQMGRARPEQPACWAERELWSPCFKVNVVGTTGSGDTTIAGFLSGLLRQYSPEKTMVMAVAVGACNVEAMDAISGLKSWEDTLARIKNGWERHPLKIDSHGWQWKPDLQTWIGPHDRSSHP